MKINHITADNFLRLNLFEVDTSKHVVHMFSGCNEAGKSSVQEAIRFALTGETIRVSAKGDYKLMIRDGAKSGLVTINVDGHIISRDIKTGKQKEYSDEFHPHEFMPYLLNAQKFAQGKISDRLNFLIELTQTSAEPDDIAKRMAAKGVHEKCIEGVKPLLRSNMDAAHKEAAKKRYEAKSMWEALTERARYGSQIAADWKPEPPKDYNPSSLANNETHLALVMRDTKEMLVDKGKLIARIESAKEEMANSTSENNFDKDELGVLEAAVSGAKEFVAIMDEELKTMNERLANARELVPVTCCECGSMLRVRFQGRNAIVEPYVPMEQDDIAKLQADIITKGADISDLNRKIAEHNDEITKQKRAEALSYGKESKSTQKDIDEMEKTVISYDETLAGYDSDVSDLNEEISKLRIADARVRDSEKISERAQSLHRAVEAWDVCVKVLAPDGLPAEMLSDTLKPINERLRNTSIVTDWPQISISPTMEIIAEGRRYSLLSESARWRADVSIADAISYLSGIGLMIIDRFDVLDIGNRAKLMNWIKSIQDDYETILLFGTLKQAPSLPGSMMSHWMESGEIMKVKEV